SAPSLGLVQVDKCQSYPSIRWGCGGGGGGGGGFGGGFGGCCSGGFGGALNLPDHLSLVFGLMALPIPLPPLPTYDPTEPPTEPPTEAPTD
ncbi:hypothetical protein, partial [Atlantibacter hermannii]|uniref:hypothetical protein n=1 Tax=Atlantibacter hermannii TaxID=565 RepID=UPI001933E98D